MKYLCILVSIYTNMKKIIVLLAFCLIACINAQSQKTEPVKWNTQINNTEKRKFQRNCIFSPHIGRMASLRDTASRRRSSFYSLVFDKIEGAVLLGNIREIDRPIEEYNSLFEMNLNGTIILPDLYKKSK